MHHPMPAFKEWFRNSMSPEFICSVRILERTEPFVDERMVFSKKKAAKRHACKLALRWLADRGHIDRGIFETYDSTPVFVHSGPTLVGTNSAGTTVSLVNPDPTESLSSPSRFDTTHSESPGQRYTILCNQMGLNLPRYVMTSTPQAPTLWSGWAEFPGEPRIDGKVAEFQNIFGKKNAKEHCQLGVLRFLEDLQRRQGSGNGRR